MNYTFDNYLMSSTTIFNVGIYLRLSQEDETAGQSESITNQKDFCLNFVLKHGWNIVNTYIDDGWTGTNYERPDRKSVV